MSEIEDARWTLNGGRAHAKIEIEDAPRDLLDIERDHARICGQLNALANRYGRVLPGAPELADEIEAILLKQQTQIADLRRVLWTVLRAAGGWMAVSDQLASADMTRIEVWRDSAMATTIYTARP